MGLYPQPNRWQCGPFALKHALVTLGIFAPEGVITEIAGTDPGEGTDERQLRKAARRFHCDLTPIRRHQPELARGELLRHLRRGHPCLLCVREWAHWVTVVKAEAGKFIVLDSEDSAVLTIYTWRQLSGIWAYHERDEHDKRYVATIYDLYPVVPRVRVRTRARFSLARARYLVELAGVDAALETSTAMPGDFLMQQMEWREALEEAAAGGDPARLDELDRRLRGELAARYAEVESELEASDAVAAAATLRKLMFLEKLREEIGAEYERMGA